MDHQDNAYRTLFQESPLAQWVFDAETLTFLDVTAGAIRQYGYSREEFLRLKVTDIRQENDLPQLYQLIQALTPDYTPLGRRRHRHKDGRELIVEVTSRRTEFNGRPAVHAVLLDITQQVRADEARRWVEERLALVARVTADAIWDWDLERGVLWWSEGLQTLFGYDPRTIEPTIDWWRERIHPEDRPRVEEGLWRALRGEATTWADEYRFQHRDQRYREVLDRGAIVRDASGRAIRMAGGMIDISEQKRVARELAASEARFRAIFEQSSLGVAQVDRDGLILRANRAFHRLLGFSPAELDRTSVFAIFPPGARERAQAALQRLVSGESSEIHGEIPCQRRDGSLFWTEATASTICDARGAPEFFLLTLEDISARKEAEAQAQQLAQSEKLRALGQMAGGVAHTLNQSLSLIVGHSQLALNELEQLVPSLDRLRESLALILQASADSALTVRRLQSFARPEALGPAQPVVVAELLEDVARLTAPRWRDLAQREGRPITLTVSAPADLTIQGWPNALRDALTNLIFNAVDALPTGGTIQLTAQRQGDRAILEVRDSGIGISEEVQERIFEPFFTTKGERGSGLGLPTVYRIVERHGGTIAVRSAPGRGTTFRLSLPLTTSEPAPAAAPSPADRLPGRRVLAVDDDPRLAEMARRMLELEGHQVVVATSGEEALALLTTQAFDVVLSDLSLGGGMTGWDLAAAVKARWPTIRFVLTTGWEAELDAEAARQRGVDAILAKPYTVSDLQRAIDR
jgi:PAS domain S-box-containing protein